MGSYTAAREMIYIWSAIAATLSGIFGAMGLGGGGVLIIYLTVFTDTPQALAQGINLLFFIPVGLISIIMSIKNKLINFKIAIPIAITGLLGSIVGSYFANFIDGKLLSKLFALLLLYMGVLQFKNKK